MEAEHVRDAAATAAIFGLFASAWFGWAQEAPPRSWRRPLMFASILSLLCFGAAAGLTWRHWRDGTVFDANTSPKFGIVVGVECAIVGVVAAVLAKRLRKHLVAPWIAAVVGGCTSSPWRCC